MLTITKPLLLCSCTQQICGKNPPYAMHWGWNHKEKKLGFLEVGTNYFTKEDYSKKGMSLRDYLVLFFNFRKVWLESKKEHLVLLPSPLTNFWPVELVSS